MTSSATTWRQKLDECETLLESESRVGWLRKAYARIYRFLISQYAGQTPHTVARQPMPFIDRTEQLDGKAARSLGEIRHTLKGISALQPVDAASHAPREKEVWVTVAVDDKKLFLFGCLECLGRHGIETRVVYEGRRRVVRVRREQASEAFAIIERARRMTFLDRIEESQPQEQVFVDPATVERRTQDEHHNRRLMLILLAGSWGALMCFLLLKSLNYPIADTGILCAAVVCIVALAGLMVHFRQRPHG